MMVGTTHGKFEVRVPHLDARREVFDSALEQRLDELMVRPRDGKLPVRVLEVSPVGVRSLLLREKGNQRSPGCRSEETNQLGLFRLSEIECLLDVAVELVGGRELGVVMSVVESGDEGRVLGEG